MYNAYVFTCMHHYSTRILMVISVASDTSSRSVRPQRNTCGHCYYIEWSSRHAKGGNTINQAIMVRFRFRFRSSCRCLAHSLSSKRQKAGGFSEQLVSAGRSHPTYSAFPYLHCNNTLHTRLPTPMASLFVGTRLEVPFSSLL